MKPALQLVASCLRNARDARGMSQRELSEFSGVPQGQISRIEAGLVDPRASTLLALAHSLDLEVTLVPRQAMPAVRALASQLQPRPRATGQYTSFNSGGESIPPVQKPAYSLDEDEDE